MFNLRITSSFFGPHRGGGWDIWRWMPLTSNLVKWKSKLHFRLDFQDNLLCQSIFFVLPDSPSLVWEDLIFFPRPLIPLLTLNCDPPCFLLGACVGFFPPPGRGSIPLLPYKELCETFLTSYSGTGLACVWYTDVSRSSTLPALE